MLLDEVKWFKRKEIAPIKKFRPRFEGFSTKTVFNLLKNDKEICDYLPVSEMVRDKYPDKKFFWGLV